MNRMKRGGCDCELDPFIVDLTVLSGEGCVAKLDTLPL